VTCDGIAGEESGGHVCGTTRPAKGSLPRQAGKGEGIIGGRVAAWNQLPLQNLGRHRVSAPEIGLKFNPPTAVQIGPHRPQPPSLFQVRRACWPL